jgi:hypothetical protein
MKRFSILLLFVFIFCITTKAQITIQVPIPTTLNPPVTCGSGTLYSNNSLPKVWIGKSDGTCVEIDSSTSAPASATYLLQTSNASLPNAQNMSALPTGLVKNTTGTGVQSIVVEGTGVETALGVNVGSPGAFVVNGGALGSPSSAGTMPAFTLGGTVSGGGNQINNVIIGTGTPLAGHFTSLDATGSISSGIGGSNAGQIGLAQGTVQPAPANSVGFTAPTTVTTPFLMKLPAAPLTGFLFNTGASDPGTLSFVANPLPVANGGRNATDAATADNALVGDGSGFVGKALGSCSAASSALTWNATTHAFGCNSIASGTTINPTNNVLPKRSNATTFVDSALTDDGTNVTSTEPIIGATRIGGTAAGSSLELRSTSGVGTTDFVKFTVGSNGASEAMRISDLTSVADKGAVGIGIVTPSQAMHLFNNAGDVSALNTYLQIENGGGRQAGVILKNTNGTWNIYTTQNQVRFYNGSADMLTLKSDNSTNFGGLIKQVNGINTAGWGVPAIYGAGRATAQNAANASVATYTVGGSDGSFEVSANVLVTTATTHNFTVECAYTDEGNTARVITMNFMLVGGGTTNFTTAIINTNGAVPYHGIPLHIRAKASTAITIRTQAAGTYTTVVYNVEGVIVQLQ